jgi:hypothetical protein
MSLLHSVHPMQKYLLCLVGGIILLGVQGALMLIVTCYVMGHKVWTGNWFYEHL